MLHYFNPGHEAAVLNSSPYYTLPANPQKMQQDLQLLPAWYADPDDFVWLDKPLPESFVQSVTSRFQKLPKVLTASNIHPFKDQLSETKAILWGLSPQGIYFFNQLNARHHLNLQVPPWDHSYYGLCSRRTARECLQTIINQIPEIAPDIVPEFYNEIGSIEQEMLKKQTTRFLIKAPYSSSGRGLLWIEPGQADQSSLQILRGMLKKQHEVSLERALDKQSDFAMLFHSNDDGSVDLKGYSLFQTDAKGNYKGNYLLSQKQIESKISESLDTLLLEKVKQCLNQYLSQCIAPHYKGCICIDMMLYRENNRIRLHPCVEINLRYSMGWLALHLFRNYFDENACGSFQIEFHKQPEVINRRHQEMQLKAPLVLKNGKIVSGYMPLCPVDNETNYSAYILASTGN